MFLNPKPSKAYNDFGEVFEVEVDTASLGSRHWGRTRVAFGGFQKREGLGKGEASVPSSGVARRSSDVAKRAGGG